MNTEIEVMDDKEIADMILPSMERALRDLRFITEMDEDEGVLTAYKVIADTFNPDCGYEATATLGANVTANSKGIHVELTKGTDYPYYPEETRTFAEEEEDEAVKYIDRWACPDLDISLEDFGPRGYPL